jgi:flagellar motor switch protein FliN/FliY
MAEEETEEQTEQKTGGEGEISEDLELTINSLSDVPVKISAVLGNAKMQLRSLLNLGRGAVIELDRNVGDAVDIHVNNKLVAKGEVVIVDNKIGVTVTDVVKDDKESE